MTTVGTRLSKLSPVEQNFLESGDALTALAERTAEVDQCVLRAAGELLFSGASPGPALLAVGGYGRRQLFPYSDVDLLLLFPSERAAEERKEAISAFLQRLWDSGLRVSQSVRTPAECTEVHDDNSELNVSLLDQRYLAGDRTLYAGVAEKLPRFLSASRESLIRNLAKLSRERYAKFGNTFYHLEPNVKETPGGLRDFQLICWLEQLREGTCDPPSELKMAFRFMARLRCYLHCLYARDANVLSFEAQDAISEQWQHADAALWMRDYYRHARTIYRTASRELENNEAQASSLFSQFRDWRSRVANQDFSVHRERAHFRAPQRIDVEPELVLRMFEFVARHGIRPSFETEQRIEGRLTKLREQFAESAGTVPMLLRIFSLPYAPLAARTMHESGVLAAIFPELNQIECLVIRDFYHRYTVDEHTLVTLQNLWSLRGTEDAPQKFYGDVLGEIKQPGLLMLALLFHDVGKGADPVPEQGHAAASVEMARTALTRIHLAPQDLETVLFLIRCHLELSGALQSRDVFDPQTIREVAHRVETVERLKALTLVTYADISAVNPTAMTPWRAEQLWQLYLMVYNELTRELEEERIEAIPTGSPERVAFLEGFPTRYLRTHSETEIDEHMALEAKSRKRGVAVEIRRLDAAWQLTLVAADHPGLFASAAGSLSSFGMNILKAEAFANKRGLVLDTFTFADPIRTLDLNPTEVDRLRSVTERAVSGKLDVRELLKNRPKPVLPSRKARIAAQVNVNSEASNSATLVEIVAQDRPGLLYDLASAISASGANIEVVLIDTEAHKAIDVFYVTAVGQKLDAERREALAAALRTAVGAGTAAAGSRGPEFGD
jgi:[protein-PII] uridylyltransferase